MPLLRQACYALSPQRGKHVRSRGIIAPDAQSTRDCIEHHGNHTSLFGRTREERYLPPTKATEGS